jgi:ribulose 1,5-bisphosphate carboxylase large subunit-like protein
MKRLTYEYTVMVALKPTCLQETETKNFCLKLHFYGNAFREAKLSAVLSHVLGKFVGEKRMRNVALTKP